MAFVIDVSGNLDNTSTSDNTNSSSSVLSSLLKDYKNSFKNKDDSTGTKSSIDEFCKSMGWTEEEKKQKPKQNLKEQLVDPKSDVDQVLKKAVITPDYDKLHTVPPIEISEKKRRELRKKERELTKGKKWYGLPATEMTPEIKNDLEIIRMRSVLDPKRFYKKNDLKVLPKYFQIGKILDSPLDHYNRLTNKERKKTLVDELLADAEFNKYNKRKFKEIIQEKQKTHYKEWKKAKKLKKRK